MNYSLALSLFLICWYGSSSAMQKKEHPCKKWWQMIAAMNHSDKDTIAQAIAQAKADGCDATISLRIKQEDKKAYEDAGVRVQCPPQKWFAILDNGPFARKKIECEAIIDFKNCDEKS